MITFTELLKRAESEKIAIHTPTEEQAKALLKALDEKGYEWNSGYKLTTKTHYEIYKENICYDFEPNKKICYCSLKFYQKSGYSIIEFKDIDFKEKQIMITFTELLKRAKREHIAVHTPTEAQAITLLVELDKRGYEWFCGEEITTTHYEDCKENTCYSFHGCYGKPLDKKITYSPLSFYRAINYSIIEFSEIDFASKAKSEPILAKGESKSLVIKTIYQSKDKATTVVIFEDGEKIKVKKHKGEKASLYTAVAYAITKKIYGSNKVFAEIVDEKLYRGGRKNDK